MPFKTELNQKKNVAGQDHWKQNHFQWLYNNNNQTGQFSFKSVLVDCN